MVFWVITGSAFIGNDLAWLNMHLDEKDGPVTIRDITQDWACLAMWGPKARAVLQKITSEDVSNEAFPYLHARTIQINGTPSGRSVSAMSASWVGNCISPPIVLRWFGMR